jgi:hypothetical protein
MRQRGCQNDSRQKAAPTIEHCATVRELFAQKLSANRRLKTGGRAGPHRTRFSGDTRPDVSRFGAVLR